MPQSPAARPISNVALVGYYAVFLLGGVVLLNVLVLALEAYLPSRQGGTTALGLFLIWGAASWVGKIWFVRDKARPASGRAWAVAMLCALVTSAVQALFVWVLTAAAPGGFAQMGFGRSSDKAILAAVFAGIFLLGLLIIRAAIAWGAKSEEKRARQAVARETAARH